MNNVDDSFGRFVGLYALTIFGEYAVSRIMCSLGYSDGIAAYLFILVWVIASIIAGIKALSVIRYSDTVREKIVLGLIAYILLSGVVWSVFEFIMYG